jgi:hypothetical protein
VTLLALDRGLAYFSGAAGGQDSLLLVVPGAQVAVTKAARLRFEAADSATQLAVLQGVARFSSPAAEIDVAQGQTSRVEPAHPSRFFLYRDVTPIDLDRWSASRDKALASAISGLHVAQRYGLADLDSSGQWIQTEDLGVVWQPKSAEGWTPYHNGRWRWLDALGYTWVSDDAWGWLPFHYGRWTRHGDLGWVWAPSASSIFKPGEVFWMRGARFTAWGPLAPGEDWNPANVPAQYVGANLTFAAFLPEAPAIDPAGFEDRPKEPLKAATFVAALPSRTMDPSRLDVTRPLVSVNALRVMPEPAAPAAPPTEAARPPRPPQPTVIVTPPAPAPEEVLVPVPVYEGFVVYVTPPPSSKPAQPAQSASAKPAPKPVTIPAPLPSHGPRHPAGRAKDGDEDTAASQVQRDFRAGRWTQALQDLDEWTRRYPQSQLIALRLYDYMQAHSAMAHPDRVLEYGAAVMTRNPVGDVSQGALDEQQTAGVLFLTMVNAQAIAKPSREQRALGAAAAQSLLDSLPRYFQDGRRPPESSAEQWATSRRQLETAAREALKKLAPRPTG